MVLDGVGQAIPFEEALNEVKVTRANGCPVFDEV
jgi:hypothetical protein